MSRVLFTAGRVIDPVAGTSRRLDVLVEDDRIAAVGPRLGPLTGVERIDCRDCFIAPGFLDLHCHLREPGREEAETIASGARAALMSGFTQVCAMPNTEPPIDSEALVRFVSRRSEDAGFARVLPVGCCTKGRQGRELAELGAMRTAGAVAFSDDGNWVENAGLMRRVLEYAKTFDTVVMSHCELAALASGTANESPVATRLGLRGNPWPAEAAAVARDVMLAELTGSRLHVCHVSCAATVEVIRWAKARGVAVTAETCPHYLVLTDSALESFDSNLRVNPPLRTEADRRALVAGIADGTIDCLATDHAPHPAETKAVEFDNAASGIIGFETAFSLLYELLVLKNHLTLPGLVTRLSTVPARILGLDAPAVAEGAEANLAVIDPAATWVFDRSQVLSQSCNSPFLGRTMRGRVRVAMLGTTLLRQDDRQA
ncbi:MAG: dihydroorotase [candidate division WOR-3 bacterium]